jgi:hypothetical protein
MTCEEFAMAALDLKPQADASTKDSAVQHSAREHLRTCARCSALQATWESLRTDLRELGAQTSQTSAPPVVATRLLAEFRHLHRNRKVHNLPVPLRWALAAAAVIVLSLGMGINHWRGGTSPASPNASSSLQSAQDVPVKPAGPELGESLVASNDENDFTLVPGVIPASLDNSTIVQVEMQRSVLGSLGFTVNEEHAADWIRVDLLVGDDGQTQAVRLPASE